jgi:PAS domain S-box-containing protein
MAENTSLKNWVPRNSPSMIRLSLNDSDDAILEQSLDGTILRWNKGVEKMFGYTGEDVIGKAAEILHPPGLESESAYILDKVQSDEPIFYFETYRRCRDGSVIPVLLTVFPVRDESGKLVGVAQLIRKNGSGTNAGTAPFIDSISPSPGNQKRSEPVIILDNTGIIREVNAAAEVATRSTRTHLIGMSFSRYFFNLDGSKITLDAILRGDSLGYDRYLIRTMGCTVMPIDCNASISKDETGNVSDITVTVRYIDQNELAISKRKDELHHLYEILEILPVYVCLLTPDYRMPYANRYFREMLGEPQDFRCFELFYGRDTPCDNCQTFSIMKTRTPRNWHWTGPNGRDYDIYDLPFLNPDGSISILEMGIDITERNQAVTALQQGQADLEARVAKRTEELKQTNDELRKANRDLTSIKKELQQNLEKLRWREQELSRALTEKEILLSEVHHRVKNNLTAFISLINLEGDGEETNVNTMFRHDLQNRARSMALIHETLYRTHLFSEVDMGVYLTNLLDQVSGSYKDSRKIQAVVQASDVLLDIPRATPAGLIVNELVTNSYKYAFPDAFNTELIRGTSPTIAISMTKNDKLYEMIVRDNGIGLPADIDLHSTRSLGLKLVMFLARHQLRADVAISRDAGTVFIIRFNENAR